MKKIKNVSPEIIKQVKDWLSPQIIAMFRRTLDTEDDLLRYHFTTGMDVRNYLRKITDYSWTDHEYDNLWMDIVKKAIQ